MSHDFQRAVTEIKLRSPIEDVVRGYVSDLKQRGSGRLWEACCPFHSEKTPSFKVDPAKGTWHCYGACAEGGDQISFVMTINAWSFMEALQQLADSTGVELPKKTGRDDSERGPDPAYDVLRRAAQFYAEALHGPEGGQARDYLAARGFTAETQKSFRVGYSPAAGQALVDWGRREQLPFELLEKVGLLRKNDRGRPFDFFRGRLMIPIADDRGRTVGFGARRLGGDAGGPKYINTAETPLFKKSRLIYGLDLSLREARREGHLILVEGYTDVMAAHQAGLARVGAVLGTSTTNDHARLVRKSGARRVSLVFDGDSAGAKAARRALHGLLPLDLELDLVTLPTGQDPCDILLGGGSEAFLAEIETGRNWFEQSLTRLATLRGAELSRAVDDLLALVQRIQSPVHRNSLWEQLAQQLGISKADLKDQWRKSAEGKHQERRAASTFSPREVAPETPAEPLQEPALKRRIDPQVARAFGEIIGAVLLDSSLVPLAKPLAKFCQEPDLKQILELVLEMYEDEHQAIDVTSVLSGLGDCPARVRVTSLAVHAESASSPKDLMDGALGCLYKRRGARQRRDLEGQARTLEQQLSQARGEDARAIKTELEETLGALRLLLQAEHPPSEPEGSRHSHKADSHGSFHSQADELHSSPALHPVDK